MGMLSRRRTFLVDRRFQLKYTFIIVFVGVAVSTLLGYFIYRLTLENTKILMLDPEMQDKVSMFDTAVIFYFVGFVVLMALVLFIWGIVITHRVAGPIFIVSRFLRQIADNLVPPDRQLRKRDEFQEFFDTYTAMVNSLNSSTVMSVNASPGALSSSAKLAKKKPPLSHGNSINWSRRKKPGRMRCEFFGRARVGRHHVGR